MNFSNFAKAAGQVAEHFRGNPAAVVDFVRANPVKAAELIPRGSLAHEEYNQALKMVSPETHIDYNKILGPKGEFNAKQAALKREAILNPKLVAGIGAMPVAAGSGFENPLSAINENVIQPTRDALRTGLDAYQNYIANPLKESFIGTQASTFHQTPETLKAMPGYELGAGLATDPMNAAPEAGALAQFGVEQLASEPKFAHGGDVHKVSGGVELAPVHVPRAAKGSASFVQPAAPGGFDPDAFLAGDVAPAAYHVDSGLEPKAFNPDEFLRNANEEQYGTPIEMLKTAAEGAAEGIAGPLAPLAETQFLGVNPEDIRARQETNPIVHGTLQAGGLGLGMFTGTGEAALLGKAGELAVGAARLGEATYAARVGSSIVRNAVENAVFQGTDEISKRILQDPQTSAESAISNIGLAGLLGGTAGGFMTGAVHPLWKATVGDKLESVLGGMTRRLNGEGDQTLLNEAKSLGVTLKPEVEAAMSEDPMLRNAYSALNQSDTTKIGRNFQETIKNFRNDVDTSLVETLGKSPKEIGSLEVSEYDHGKAIGDALVSEYKAKIDPIIKTLEESKVKFADADLPKRNVEKIIDPSNPYALGGMEKVMPGITDTIADKIAQRAADESWLTGATPDIARVIRSVTKDLKNVDTLGELIKMGQAIGQNTKSNLPFGQQTPLSRAGMIMRELIHDAENSFVAKELGTKQGPEAFAAFTEALGRFKEVAKLKDALNDRLKVGGSVSGFAKGLAEMSKTDAESLLRRLNGKNDADGLKFLSENFPGTATQLRQYHIEKTLEAATRHVKEGQLISQTRLLKAIESMSPEMREFAFSPEQLQKVEGLSNLSKRLDYSTHNFSNTARTVDKLMSGMGSSALASVAYFTGHGAVAAAVPFAALGIKESRDALRLGMLKYLGSSQPVDAAGFKAMMSFLNNAVRGEANIVKATQAVFKSGAHVLSSDQMPTEKENQKLAKQVDELEETPTIILKKMNGSTGHYLPDHQQSLVEASTRALQYLQSIKPRPYQFSALDAPIEPDSADMARYDRALSIANNPNYVLQQVKDGTVLSTDLADLKIMFPGLYQRMAQELNNNMTDKHAAEELIPYTTRMGVSLFLGAPVDATMKPQSIMAAQPAAQMPPAAPSPKAGSPSKLGKTAKNYMTPNQSAESDRASRD